MNDITWPRRAPAARSRPTSRIRSVTVIDSVLKMRNAPANRAIAAISAVVAWKSVVDARSEAARSCGEDSTYGCVWQPRLERGGHGRRVGRAGRAPMSTRVTPVSPKTGLRGPQRDDDGPPEGAGQRSVAAR